MENEIVNQRIKKIEELREQGIEPYSNDFKPSNVASDIHEQYDNSTNEDLEPIDEEFSLAGRVVAIRDFGKTVFFHITDRTGKLQGYIRKDTAGEELITFFKKYVDIGDYIGVKGGLFKTKTGELTLKTSFVQLLTKSLHPLPEKWHGLKDVETRFRQRYLDLIANPETKDTFAKRHEIIKLIRKFLDDRDFMEVETPILHPIAGGAAARPFQTHHNALDMELYLRIAPELYLKRLLIGGFERVFELGRTFRNEGLSTHHNPEFTMVEFYQSYATYEDLMDLIEEMLCYVAETVLGTLEFEYQGMKVDFTRPWKRLNIYESIKDMLGNDILDDEKKLFDKDPDLGVPHKGIRGKAIVEIFEALIGEKIVDPTFVYGYPLDVSPLARKNDDDPEITDRFELYICGREIANAFSELNDPIDQKSRFVNQLVMKEKGEEEVHEMDHDFITALEYGMPPAAGAGIGVDRLVMLLTDSPSIREVLFFPHLRPE